MATVPDSSTISLSAAELAALREEIAAMPKVELHRHLEGSLRFSTLKMNYCTRVLGLDKAVVEDVFTQRGTLNAPGVAIYLTPAAAPAVRKNIGAVVGGVDASNPANGELNGVPAEEELIQRTLDYYCCVRPCPSLKDFLAKFDHTAALFDSVESVEQLTYEVVADCALVNTRVLELRYSPFFMAGAKDIPFADLHDAIQKGVARAQAEFPGIAVGLIAIIERQRGTQDANTLMDFVEPRRDTFIAIDIANNEVDFPPSLFTEALNRAAAAKIPITIHAGEVPVPEAPQWVLDCIENLGATRIGHGFNIMRDAKAVEKAAQSGAVFEVCPSSNYLCEGVSSVAEHPLPKMMADGLACTLNTDDPGMFGVDMNTEIEVAVTVLGLSIGQIKEMMQRAYNASFINDEIKSKVWSAAL